MTSCGVFIVNFETDFTYCSGASIVDQEQVNAGLVYKEGKRSIKAAIKIFQKNWTKLSTKAKQGTSF